MEENLIQLSKEYKFAKTAYEHAVRTLIRTAPVLQNKSVFWQIIDDIANHIEKQLEKRDDPVRNGICVWLKAVELNNYDYDFDDIPSFIVTYAKLKESLAKRILSIGPNLSDVVDALPLAGKKICLLILEEKISDFSQLSAFFHKFGRLEDQILKKENHVEQWLEQCYSDRLCEFLVEKNSLKSVD